MTPEAIDDYLSLGAFGDAVYLQDNCATLYSEITAIVADRSKVPLDSPYDDLPLSRKVVLRREIDFTFAELAEGKPISNIDKLGQIAATPIRRDAAHHVQVAGTTLFADWRTDPQAADIRDAFVRSMKSEGATIEGQTPDERHVHTARDAIMLMNRALPKTFAGTQSLAPGACLVSGEVSSAYINENPFCYFINETQFRDTALLSETLLHEALHEKMACIRLTSNLLRAGYDDMNSEQCGDVLVPWPDLARPRYWSFARALAAYHVYVHTAAYYGILSTHDDLCADCTPEVLKARLGIQLERALWLHEALQAPRCRFHGDVDYDQFLIWMGKSLEQTRITANAIPDVGAAMKTWDMDAVRHNAETVAAPKTEVA